MDDGTHAAFSLGVPIIARPVGPPYRGYAAAVLNAHSGGRGVARIPSLAVGGSPTEVHVVQDHASRLVGGQHKFRRLVVAPTRRQRAAPGPQFGGNPTEMRWNHTSHPARWEAAQTPSLKGAAFGSNQNWRSHDPH